MPNLSPSSSQLKSTFSLYIVPLSSLRLACGSWVGFRSDLRWSDHIYGGLICVSMGLCGSDWFLFLFRFSFHGWWWWCGCGFVILVVRVVVWGGGDNGSGWMGFVSIEVVFFFGWRLVVEWVLWLVGYGGWWLFFFFPPIFGGAV